jgi:dihydropteroate synthase
MSTVLSELLKTNRPIVMGILNSTPDSFSDGGKFNSAETAINHALAMLRDGADIIDVGGESTRPGAAEVSVSEEIARVVPVIQRLRQQSAVCISIDSSKPEVMRAAVQAGANFINDVNGLRGRDALAVCAELNVAVCVMHMQGQPRTMQHAPKYDNVVEDIKAFLSARVDACIAAGIKPDNIVIDPGFGFGKSLQHNFQLLNNLNEFETLGLPILVGLSRKSMLGALLNSPLDDRLHASVAAAVLAWTKGAKIFRVHDVKPTVDALKVCAAMEKWHSIDRSG